MDKKLEKDCMIEEVLEVPFGARRTMQIRQPLSREEAEAMRDDRDVDVHQRHFTMGDVRVSARSHGTETNNQDHLHLDSPPQLERKPIRHEDHVRLQGALETTQIKLYETEQVRDQYKVNLSWKKNYQQIADELSERALRGIAQLGERPAKEAKALSFARVKHTVGELLNNALVFMEDFGCTATERAEVRGGDLEAEPTAGTEAHYVGRRWANLHERLTRLRTIAQRYQALAHAITPSTPHTAGPVDPESAT